MWYIIFEHNHNSMLSFNFSFLIHQYEYKQHLMFLSLLFKLGGGGEIKAFLHEVSNVLTRMYLFTVWICNYESIYLCIHASIHHLTPGVLSLCVFLCGSHVGALHMSTLIQKNLKSPQLTGTHREPLAHLELFIYPGGKQYRQH